MSNENTATLSLNLSRKWTHVLGHLLLVLGLGDGAEREAEARAAGQVRQVDVVLELLHPARVRRAHVRRVAHVAQRLRPVVDSRLHVDLQRQPAGSTQASMEKRHNPVLVLDLKESRTFPTSRTFT